MRKSKIIKITIIAVAVIGAAIAGIYTFKIFPVEKIDPSKTETDSRKGFTPTDTVTAVLETVKETYEAVGTIRPQIESSIGSQVTAQVVDVKVKPGDTVAKGDLLVVLDSRQFQSRLDQAKQGLKQAVSAKAQARQGIASAQAAYTRAQADYKRFQTYFESQAATEQQLEQARSAYLQARAELNRAREGLSGAEAQIQQAEEMVKEADISQGYTQLSAPESGEVLRRLVEPGDLAVPGKPLIMLQTTGALRLEAHIREGLIRQVKVGDRLQVEINPLDKILTATVEEIIPYADPQTRTFLVKAALPQEPFLYPGMFGKLLIPVREVQVILIPEGAIRQVGQLELVKVKEADKTWVDRYIKTGKKIGNRVEVLSGLDGNETLALWGN